MYNLLEKYHQTLNYFSKDLTFINFISFIIINVIITINPKKEFFCEFVTIIIIKIIKLVITLFHFS